VKAYAHGTKVPADRTRSEIELLLEKNGAVGSMFGTVHGQALVAFEMRDRRLKFTVPMPTVSRRDSEQKVKAEIRRRWRALLLVLKAKLEAVRSGVVEFDVEFLPFIVVRGNETIGEQIVPQLAETLAGGKLPPLLGAGS
jgi:hypothetical protein